MRNQSTGIFSGIGSYGKSQCGRPINSAGTGSTVKNVQHGDLLFYYKPKSLNPDREGGGGNWSHF